VPAGKLKEFFFLLITYPQYIIFSLKNLFFAKFCVRILFCQHYFSPLKTFMGKGKDPVPDPDLYLRLMGPDPRGPKSCVEEIFLFTEERSWIRIR
jgi:hypothetical protein